MRRIFAFAMACVFAVSLTAAAVDTSAVPSRAADIRPGEWIILQDTSGHSSDTNKITVLERNGDVLKLRREHYDSDGNLLETSTNDMDLSKYAQRAADVKSKALDVTEEFMMIDDQGHEMVGLLWEDTDKSGEKHQYKVLVSPNIPITGVARYWSSNPESPVGDVIGYGFGNN